ncbi:universal stress protein [Paraburkholderia sp. J8-2]|uniref:universal stress protein n=1 Tax=Paraburkholderia sp. J8-2 TaxID=2805440 RepID=UPI002AB6DF17|nr:universal stress protein [Paraburkholderia sp. J8-2]
MYSRIPIALDCGDASREALTEGLRLARLPGSKVCVAHVIHIPPPFGMGIGTGMPNLPVEFWTSHRARAHCLLDSAQREATALGVRCEVDLLLPNTPTDTISMCIRRCAVRFDAELVVLGTRGRRGVARAIKGSVAERFARESTCPVLIVNRALGPSIGREGAGGLKPGNE